MRFKVNMKVNSPKVKCGTTRYGHAFNIAHPFCILATFFPSWLSQLDSAVYSISGSLGSGVVSVK